MAKFLDYSGLTRFKAKLETLFAKKTDIPTSLPPNGIARGDLVGSYPNPLVNIGKRIWAGSLGGNILVKTKRASEIRSTLVFTITGYTHSNTKVPFHSIIQFTAPINQGQIFNYTAVNLGADIAEFKVFDYNGFIYLSFLGDVDATYFLHAYCSNSGSDQSNQIDTLEVAEIPTAGVTRQVTIVPVSNILSNTNAGGDLVGTFPNPQVQLGKLKWNPGDAGMLIKTKRLSENKNTMVFMITGRNVNNDIPFFSILQFTSNIYPGSITNGNAINLGANISEFNVFDYNGYIYVWFPAIANANYYIYAYESGTRETTNQVDTLTEGAVPEGVTRKIVINPISNILSNTNAGGDLTGTFPTPTVASGKITESKLSADVQTKLNKTGSSLAGVDSTYSSGTTSLRMTSISGYAPVLEYRSGLIALGGHIDGLPPVYQLQLGASLITINSSSLVGNVDGSINANIGSVNANISDYIRMNCGELHINSNTYFTGNLIEFNNSQMQVNSNTVTSTGARLDINSENIYLRNIEATGLGAGAYYVAVDETYKVIFVPTK